MLEKLIPIRGRAVAIGFASLMALTSVGSLVVPGCTTETCVGGVKVNGVCEGKCDPAKCLAGNTCIANRCELVCDKPADCNVDTQTCVAQTDDLGAAVNVCETNPVKSKSLGAACPLGPECDAISTCPDGTPCGADVASPTCAEAECLPLHCISGGVGDSDAYCSNYDCTKDTDCGTGMYCGVVRLPQNVCNTGKGSTDPCVNAGDATTLGATVVEGPISFLRNICRKRVACSTCVSDDDCSLGLNQSCVTIGTESVCATPCSVPKDCEDDHTCAGGFCVPKTGSCTGTGQFCEPCINDLSCAAGGPTVYCAGATGDQKACVDFNAKSCKTDVDCPLAPPPSTKHGKCLDGSVGVAAGKAGYHTCYLPFNAGTNKFKCF